MAESRETDVATGPSLAEKVGLTAFVMAVIVLGAVVVVNGGSWLAALSSGSTIAHSPPPCNVSMIRGQPGEPMTLADTKVRGRLSAIVEFKFKKYSLYKEFVATRVDYSASTDTLRVQFNDECSVASIYFVKSGPTEAPKLVTVNFASHIMEQKITTETVVLEHELVSLVKSPAEGEFILVEPASIRAHYVNRFMAVGGFLQSLVLHVDKFDIKFHAATTGTQ